MRVQLGPGGKYAGTTICCELGGEAVAWRGADPIDNAFAGLAAGVNEAADATEMPDTEILPSSSGRLEEPGKLTQPDEEELAQPTTSKILTRAKKRYGATSGIRVRRLCSCTGPGSLEPGTGLGVTATRCRLRTTLMIPPPLNCRTATGIKPLVLFQVCNYICTVVTYRLKVKRLTANECFI